MREISLAILFFFLSLMSSGLYMLGVAIVWLILCLLMNYNKLGRVRLFHGDYWLVFIFIVYCVFSMGINRYNSSVNIYIVAMIYMLFSYFSVSLLLSYNIDLGVKIFRFLIVVLCGSLLVQIITYWAGGYYVDFNSLFSFGYSESRYLSKTFQEFEVIRPTSFFTEPSNASAVISIVTFCYLIIFKKVDGYVFLGFISSMMTLSTAGILIGSISISVVFLFNRSGVENKVLKYGLIPIICFTLIALFLMFSYERLNNVSEYDMLATRSVLFDIILNQNSLFHIFGNGINVISTPVYSNGYYIYDYTIRDSGFLLNLYYSFGILGTMAFIVWSKLKLKDNMHFLLFFIILNGKFDYLQPVFWMLIFIVSMVPVNRRVVFGDGSA
ncbi:hypothetical protein [Aeromonas dhakensis]|uniref:hypothetical protein n=1 Tax=Aeromonas dhakensis TaxID=196024 RepID=UPI00366C85B6